MRTRSRSRHKIAEPLRIEFPSQEDQFQEDPPEVLMADNQTMAQLLQVPIEGYEDAIVIPEIAATNFELKHGLINLVQNKQFFRHDNEDPHAHIRYFNMITSTMRVPNVIEFGDSYEAPAENPTTGLASDGTCKKKGRTVTLTTDDMQKRKNDVKARTTLLLSLPDEHQLRFNDIEEMDIKWNMVLLSMRADRFWKKIGKKISIQGTDVAGFDKSKVECFNCHKMGYFVREYRALRSQDRGRRDNYRQGSNVEEQTPKALMAIDGVGWDWTYMANDEENLALVADEEAYTEFALMAKTSAECEVFDSSLCSKACKKNTDSLNSKITELTNKLFDGKNMIYHYKLGLAQVEARLAEHRSQELKYCEKKRVLEFKTESRENCIESLIKDLELLKKEKGELETKLTGFQTASKDIDSLRESQRLDKNKEGLGYSIVPPPPAQIYSPPKKDLFWTGLLV
nr:ribonuclease H-like domain-containing protein [Tanacetum cinerariifolium]